MKKKLQDALQEVCLIHYPDSQNTECCSSCDVKHVRICDAYFFPLAKKGNRWTCPFPASLWRNSLCQKQRTWSNKGTLVLGSALLRGHRFHFCIHFYLFFVIFPGGKRKGVRPEGRGGDTSDWSSGKRASVHHLFRALHWGEPTSLILTLDRGTVTRQSRKATSFFCVHAGSHPELCSQLLLLLHQAVAEEERRVPHLPTGHPLSDTLPGSGQLHQQHGGKPQPGHEGAAADTYSWAERWEVRQIHPLLWNKVERNCRDRWRRLLYDPDVRMMHKRPQ